MDPSTLPLLLSTARVATEFDMSRFQVVRLLKSGAFGNDWESFPHTGKQYRIPRDRVLAYAQTGPAASSEPVEAKA